MNSEVCDRCRLKYSLFKCENCQESFCSECDSYIHSISSKNGHIRKMIYSQSTHDTISKLNSNFDPNENNFTPQVHQIPSPIQNNNISQIPTSSNGFYDEPYNLSYEINNGNDNLSQPTRDNFYNNENNSEIINENLIFDSLKNQNQNFQEINNKNNIYKTTDINNNNGIYNDNKMNKNMSGFYINEIKNIYACEKNELIAKIDELSRELVNTKTNLGEHIDYLNNYIIQLENKYKQQIVDLTLQNSNNLRSNTIKQDTRVKELESELSIEKEKNEKLKKKLEEYEQELKNKKNDIEKLSDEKVYMNDAKKASEERLRQKISSLEKTHSDELNKMKSDYENELSKIKSELDETKMNYFKMTEESKGNLDKMMNDRNKEKLYYDNIINNLKQDIANKTFENEKLSNITKNLQQDNDVLNEKVNQMNDEIYSKEQEQQEMLKKMNKIKEEKNDYARKNSQLNSVVYGRFKKIVKNKV